MGQTKTWVVWAAGTLCAASATVTSAPGQAANASASEKVQVSTVWSGYVRPTTRSVTSVAANWTVPTLRCAVTPNALSNAWVGVGGASPHAAYPFPQAGTDSDCVNGTQSDDYWCSNNSFRKNLSVSAGDKINARVWEFGGKWRCLVDDETAHDSATAVLNYPYHGESKFADFIVERPGGARETLADFGSLEFNDLNMMPHSRFDNPKDTYAMHESLRPGAKDLSNPTLNPLVLHYVGGAASASQPAPPGQIAPLSWGMPAPIDSGKDVTSVSCASPTYSAAVDSDGNILSYNGSGWTTAESSDDQLNSVSCASASYCAAVGYDDSGGNVFSNSGGSWSSPEILDAGYKLHSISCPTTTFCEVGAAVNVFTVDGMSESSPHAIDQSNNETNESGYGLPSMSCPTPSFCATVDGSGNAFILNGSTWSAPQDIDDDTQLDSVACASASFCMAVDTDGNAFTYNGSVWSGADAIEPNNTAVEAVSCPSARFCVAVDADGNALTYNSTTWSAPSSIDSGHQLSSVSCPLTSFCEAVDVNGNFVVATEPSQRKAR